MALTQTPESNMKYIYIVGGCFKEQVEEGTLSANRREYEKADKSVGIKYEISYCSLDGKITNIKFRDSDYGKLILIEIDNDIQLSMNTESRYFMNFARKLPAIDLGKKVNMSPYDFETAEGKRMVGISVVQNEEKIKDYYYDGKKNLNNLPNPPEGEKDKDDWKIYFTTVKKFLIRQIEDMVTEPNKVTLPPEPITGTKPQKKKSEDEILEEDMPF